MSTIVTSPTCRIVALHGIQIPSVFRLLGSAGRWSDATPPVRAGLCRTNSEKVLTFPRLIQMLDWRGVLASYGHRNCDASSKQGKILEKILSPARGRAIVSDIGLR